MNVSTTIKSRFSFATAAALLAISTASMAGPASAAATAEVEQPGRCYGINTCKGTSLCATAKNDCKGLNSCKGEGVLVRTKTACLSAGGTLTETK